MTVSNLPCSVTEHESMSAVIQAPVDLVEAVATLRLPSKTNQLRQTLMDRTSERKTALAEREDLEALVQLSETLALVRAQALHCWSVSRYGAEIVHEVMARAG